MKRDDIIRMAREAGDDVEHTLPSDLDFLERFAAFVAAVEREACARVCDAEGREWDSDDIVTEKNYAAHCAEEIRARGDA